MSRSTWVEVSREALVRNLDAVAAHAGVPVCAVVKANAYGHGLVETARAFVSGGAAMLGVTRIEEARALRDGGVDAAVLILMPVPDPAEAVALRCDVTVGSATEIADLPAEARAHLKIDTGMGRLGVAPSEAVEAARSLGPRLAGVWTHFADAAGSSGRAQLERFLAAVAAIDPAPATVTVHAANSAACLAMPDARLDMVRVGTLLYGQHPPGARAPFELAETLRWYARVAAVRELIPGATVGYGSEWRARRRARVATIPVGYADGFGLDPAARTPSAGRAARALASAVLRRRPRLVSFDDRPAPVIGRVAMNALAVDVTHLPEVRAGALARLPGRRMLIDPTIERVHG